MMQVVEDEELVLQKGIQPTARITKIIQQVIDKHKLKDMVYDLQCNFTMREVSNYNGLL